MFRDTMDQSYALGDGDTPLVQPGDAIAAGDGIARVSRPETIVAYAAMLGLSVEAAAEEVARYEGTTYTAGLSLGRRSVGLTVRTVSAPASGVARALPNSGAICIRNDNTEHEQRARYGGIVRAVSKRAIIVTSNVARCRYAFADDVRNVGSLHIVSALLDSAITDETIVRPSPAGSSVSVAHIASVAQLKLVLRSFHGTLFVGSVTEPVAWALIERSQIAASRRANEPDIVVLYGVGDEHHGARTVTSFRHFHGAQVTLNRFTQTVTIIPLGDKLPDGGCR